jgi:hypothetical protein
MGGQQGKGCGGETDQHSKRGPADDGIESGRPRQQRIDDDLIVDRSGLPLSIGMAGAPVNHSQAFEPFVCGIPLIRPCRGPADERRRHPAKLHGDKGYGHPRL